MPTLSEVIAATEDPVTRTGLAGAVRAAGIRPGQTLLVHVSLSSLGYVVGEAVAVVQALLDALGEAGTLAMPAFSDALGDPGRWTSPPVPARWWPIIEAEMPAFDPALTPVWRMIGAVPELFRRWPGAYRSDHPQASFAARGPLAERITAAHRFGCAFGEGSPLARLYEADAQILLLGVGFERCTAFHLAEARAGILKTLRLSAPLLVDGVRR